ncbi:MAG: flocculation-associated PEP-CTERM protein PepA [Pseudomonadota bacterium]|nr:flocculation-associated PEP-CTERM protein PepA [Pseudomonadota bacterium]
MNVLKKLICTATVALSMASAHAGVMNNWVFNPNGGGYASGQAVGSYLDMYGSAFVQITATSADTFNFVEHGAFDLYQADSNSQPFPSGGNITATFEAYGSGHFNGAYAFGGGDLQLFHNPVKQYGKTDGIYGANLGTHIADLEIMFGGGGNVDGNGGPVAGSPSTVLVMGWVLAPGYFFDGSGNDLLSDPDGRRMMLNFTSNGVAPDLMMVGELACEFSHYTGPGCGLGTYSNVAGNHYFTRNTGGELKLLSANVPEPGSPAILAIGLLGAGIVLRKRGKKA